MKKIFIMGENIKEITFSELKPIKSIEEFNKMYETLMGSLFRYDSRKKKHGH
jgi:hypothetical protein